MSRLGKFSKEMALNIPQAAQISEKIFHKKNIYYFFYISLFFSFFTQISSAVTGKAFWLDEWFIISTIKFRNADTFWYGSLDYYQAFPRLYLYVIKVFSSIFDYSTLSLRAIPFFVQIAAFLLYFKVIKKYFKWPPVFICLGSLLFISLQTSVVYFSQIKHYSIEILMSAVAVYQFYTFGSKKINYLFFFIGPLISLTYPVTIAPLFLYEFFNIVFFGKFKIKKDFILACCVFLSSCAISYFMDIRFFMGHDVYPFAWAPYLVNYKSVWGFFSFLGNGLYNFFTIVWPNALWLDTWLGHKAPVVSMLNYTVKPAIFFISMAGLISFLFNRKNEIEKYVIILLGVLLALYMAKMMALGPNRLNCSFAIINICCFIAGARWLVKIFESRPFLQRSVVGFSYGVALFPLALGYAGELQGRNDLFSRSVYENFGNAITQAIDMKADLYVAEAALAGFVEPELLFRTHPDNTVTVPKDIIVVKSCNEICTKKPYVFIDSTHSYRFAEQKHCM